MDIQRAKNIEGNLEEVERNWYYIPRLIKLFKTMYWHKDRQLDEWNRTVNLETVTYTGMFNLDLWQKWASGKIISFQ